jgi:hypothetical protein
MGYKPSHILEYQENPMRTLGTSLGVLLFGLFIGVGAANADSIVAVSVPTVTFTGNSLCGATHTALCVEAFHASFEWDNTTEEVVPGTPEIAVTGPLGGFSFFDSDFTTSGPGGGQLLLVAWTDSAGDELTADVDTTSAGLTPGKYPIVGPSQPGDGGSGFGCNDLPTNNCVILFFGLGGREIAPNPIVVTPVGNVATPEGSTSSMLFLGALMLVMYCSRLERFVR